MNGYSREEILKERDRIEAKFSGNEFIDSYIDVPEMMGDTRIWCLGESIKMMADADLVVVPHEAYRYDGCSVELSVAEIYGIPICKIEMYPRRNIKWADIEQINKVK